MQPTFTHVPPNPHLDPTGEGFTKSASPTLTPKFAASCAQAKPPDPPPMIKMSKSKFLRTLGFTSNNFDLGRGESVFLTLMTLY